MKCFTSNCNARAAEPRKIYKGYCFRCFEEIEALEEMAREKRKKQHDTA